MWVHLPAMVSLSHCLHPKTEKAIDYSPKIDGKAQNNFHLFECVLLLFLIRKGLKLSFSASFNGFPGSKPRLSIFLGTRNHFLGCPLNHRIGLYGKIYRKALYLMVKTMVSCRFSLKPIQWLKLRRGVARSSAGKQPAGGKILGHCGEDNSPYAEDVPCW